MMRLVLINATKSGTMMNELVVDDLMRESILVPSLPEQRAVGALFSRLDSLIALHQRKEDEAIGWSPQTWEQRKLGDVYRKCTEKMMVLTIQIQLSLSRECPIARRLGLPNSPT